MDLDKTVLDIMAKAEFYRDEQLGLLKRLVSFDSGTGNVEGNRRVVEALEPVLLTMAPTVERLESPGVGIHLITRVGKPGAGRKVLCLAHLDTVFGNGEAGDNPFRVEGDRAFGLGVVDCKAGVVVSLYGLKIALELGLIPDDLEITLIYNCDEETGSRTARPIFEEESKEAQLAFVFEPSRDREVIIAHHRGLAYGYVEAVARTERACREPRGASNAELAIDRITASLESHNDPSRGIYFHVLPAAGPEGGGEAGPGGWEAGREGEEGDGDGAWADDWEDYGEGTVDGWSVYGDTGWDPDAYQEAEADFLATFENDEGLGYVRRTIDKVAGSVWAPGCLVNASMRVSWPPEGKAGRAAGVVKKAGARLGLSLTEEKPRGLSDGYWCSLHGLSTVDSMGPSMHDIHTRREALSLRTVKERTELFALSIALLEGEFYQGPG
ncbi:MAG: M20/M25/M40 family metallo-hydrolase [Deltaproteobacteria bacterium]|jgi:glutamate carboxypeptidase|nr:M20/M25/M40 family metallo-hydrolase [Deltaproteobacteria bacterium]